MDRKAKERVEKCAREKRVTVVMLDDALTLGMGKDGHRHVMRESLKGEVYLVHTKPAMF